MWTSMDRDCVIYTHNFSVHFTYNLSLVFDNVLDKSNELKIQT